MRYSNIGSPRALYIFVKITTAKENYKCVFLNPEKPVEAKVEALTHWFLELCLHSRETFSKHHRSTNLFAHLLVSRGSGTCRHRGMLSHFPPSPIPLDSAHTFNEVVRGTPLQHYRSRDSYLYVLFPPVPLLRTPPYIFVSQALKLKEATKAVCTVGATDAYVKQVSNSYPMNE